MIGALIIVFREVVEAGLVVGIVLAVTQAIPQRLRYISGGIAAGVCGAGIVAMFTGLIAEALAGTGQEVFNAAILAIAVVMLTWHNVWMARHGRELTAELREIGRDVSSGSKPLIALAIVVAVAVLREGSEIVLFLYGIIISSGASGASIFLGGMLGLLLGAGVAYLTFRGLVAIPMRHLFRVTTLLISFIAAGMAVQAVAFLEQANLATALDRTVWDTSSILPDSGVIGRLLHVLMGYTDQPTELQLLVYVATLASIYVLMKVFSPRAQPLRQAPAA
ncbi:MAG TPA: FTR1 family protein [Methylovirgula sp.]|nr:FTR1 family protein [Methylovirgula sp.]